MASIREMIGERIAREMKVEHDAHVSFAELVTPAFIGGIIIGIILGIPGLNLLIPLAAYGGYYAVGLVREYYEKYITEHDAFKVGIVAGIIGAFIGTTIMLIIAVFYGDSTALFFRSIMDYRTADVVLTLSGLDPYLSISTLKLRLVANLAIGIGMGAIGGGYFIKRQAEKEYNESFRD
jgi:hypothetical protein